MIKENFRVLLNETFLSKEEADKLYNQLLSELKLEEREIKMFGKTIMQPRLMAYYGDHEATYTYSRTTFKPKPWTEGLLFIKSKVESLLGCTFNAVLANYYRNGQDSMGWHADDEKELGVNPIVVSLSLGEDRALHFKPKKGVIASKITIPQKHGSLLIVAGNTQENWLHSIPKNRTSKGRLNLTFRRILRI